MVLKNISPGCGLRASLMLFFINILIVCEYFSTYQLLEWKESYHFLFSVLQLVHYFPLFKYSSTTSLCCVVFMYGYMLYLQVFGDVFVEDPLFISEIAQTLVMQYEQENTRKSPKEKQPGIVAVMGKVMEVCLNKNRFLKVRLE